MAEYEIEFRCKHCGKPITVLYPSRWGYKVRNKKGGWNYFCTWKCLRADERKEPKPVQTEEPEKETKNNRVQVLEEMLDAVSDGRDVYDYLRDMGYTDPKDTLRRLRITAKKEAPKLYTKMEKAGLMDMRKGRSGKGADNVNKLTREQKEKAVKLALEGGDYLNHLKKCGAKNPSAAWWYIKKTLAKSNPKLLAQVMKKTGEIEEIKAPENTEGGPTVEKAEKLPPEADVPPLDEAMEEVKERLKDDRVKLGEKHKTIGDAFEELAQGLQTRLNQTKKPVNYDGMKIMSVRGRFGTYSKEGANDSCVAIYYEPMAAYECKVIPIIIDPKSLAAFLDEVRRAAQILGVDAG